MTLNEKRLIIIDSNALLHRSFHALPALATKKGEPTGAIYGFLLTLFKIIADLKPDYIAACFDFPGPTFRHKKFKEYKAQRPKTPEDLVSQISKIKEILKNLNIPVFEKEGFEADDLIATISTEVKKERLPIKNYILTGDLDLLQLVDEDTKVYTPTKGIKETILYDKEKILLRFGIKPEQMVDFKALCGDPSDNIPGVLGIGKKTAAELLKKFGSLEKIYQEIKQNKTAVKPRIREILLKDKERAFFSQNLVRVKSDVPFVFDIKECELGEFNRKDVAEVLKRFEFYTLLKRLESFDSFSKQDTIESRQKFLI